MVFWAENSGKSSDRGTGTQSTFSSKTMTDCQSPAVTLLPLAGTNEKKQPYLVALWFLYQIRQAEDEVTALFPAQAGVGDGLAVDAAAHLLGAILQVGFHHEAFDQGGDLRVEGAAVHDVLADADLLQVFLAGVVVVGVHNDGGVVQAGLPIELQQVPEVLIMIIGMGAAEAVHIAPEDGVGEGIASGADFPVPVDEFLGALGRGDGVHHHGDITGGGVLHAHGDIQAAGHQAVLLVFHGAGADSHIAQQVRKIAVVCGIEHLFRTGEAGFPDDPHMELADGDDAGQEILLLFRIRLVEHALVAHALGAGLVGIDPGNDEKLFADLTVHFRQAGHVFQHRVFPVGGTGADDQ